MLNKRCLPVGSDVCGKNGYVIAAAGWLSGHYSMDVDCNREGAVLPWIWTSRFAAELTIQGCAQALDPKYSAKPPHNFGVLISQWCEAAGCRRGPNQDAKNRFDCQRKMLKQYYESIDKIDPHGMAFRYPPSYLENIEGFDGHCDWPLNFRRLIASVCDITKNELPDDHVCINAIDYLRYSAANGACPGAFGVDLDEDTLGLDPVEFSDDSPFSITSQITTTTSGSFLARLG